VDFYESQASAAAAEKKKLQVSVWPLYLPTLSVVSCRTRRRRRPRCISPDILTQTRHTDACTHTRCTHAQRERERERDPELTCRATLAEEVGSKESYCKGDFSLSIYLSGLTTSDVARRRKRYVWLCPFRAGAVRTEEHLQADDKEEKVSCCVLCSACTAADKHFRRRTRRRCDLLIEIDDALTSPAVEG
jgi:hypothetical protein